MATVKFNIGSSIPVRLEKWTQAKNGSGSNSDVLVTSFTCYANVDNVSGSRVFEGGQLKERQDFDIVVRNKALEGNDVNVLWKVVFRGRRHTVLSKKVLNLKQSDFMLTLAHK